MGNTVGPNGFWIGSSRHVSFEVPQVVVHEADEPNAVVDLLDADLLPSKDVTQIDFAAFEANSAAVGDDHAPIVKRIFELLQAAGTRVNASRLSPGWFATVRIPMIAGRDFRWQDRDGSLPVVVVNDTLARQFWNGNAIGQRIRYGSGTLEVVGVVQDSN
jgi:hypothetical protein